MVLSLSTLAAPIAAASAIAGMTVFLDPGHNGANDASINRQVTNGRGGTKECQTTGTTTDGGFPEHSFNWDVVLGIRATLTQYGCAPRYRVATTTRSARAWISVPRWPTRYIPTRSCPIHADGGPPDGRGFHVNYSNPPLNAAQAGPAVRFAQIMRDQLVAAGMQPSTYRGTDGLYGRADLAGLNLAQYPSILIEMGNMKNAADAAVLESAGGRSQLADAVVSGITAYLTQAPRSR